MNLRKIIRAVVSAVFLGCLYFSVESYIVLNQSLNNQKQLKWEVPSGSSFSRIMASLEEQQLLPVREGVIPTRWYIYAYAALWNLFRTAKAGTYVIGEKSSILEILNCLKEGKSAFVYFRINAGSVLADVIADMRAKNYLSSSRLAETLIPVVDEELTSLEGWLYPDTYFFSHPNDEIILDTAYAKMRSILEKLWKNKAPGNILQHPYEALVLASIIEKETHYNPEKSLIAGVFLSRLKRGMRLQADPTVLYAVNGGYGKKIKKSDLKFRSPYNTYLHEGLPPTPISMPGYESIYAVMHPEMKDYLYFVSSGNGRHYFSKTYAEHINAINKYLK